MDGNVLLVPAGTVGSGTITSLKKARSFGRNGALDITSVSYTHLDVYKRQLFKRSNLVYVVLLVKLYSILHLICMKVILLCRQDVYKRQLQMNKKIK